MPRLYSAAQSALIESGRFGVWSWWEVTRGSGGAPVELTALGGANWVEKAAWRWGIDAPLVSGTLTLRREARVGGQTLSLAPLMEESGLNLDAGGLYDPLVVPPNFLTGYLAVAPLGASAADAFALRRPVVRGKIDYAGWQDDPMTIQFRDVFAFLMHATVRDVIAMGSDAGDVLVEDVMQALLDMKAGDTPLGAVALRVIGAPTLRPVRRYAQQPGALLNALVALANAAGAMQVRGEWDDADDAWKLTLRDPPRDKTVPDLTLPPSRILRVDQMSTGDTDIGNILRVPYWDRLTRQWRSVTRDAPASVLKYGERFMQFPEDEQSLLDTQPEVIEFADKVLADTSTPLFTHKVTSLVDPRVDLNTLFAFPANAFTHSSELQLAALGASYELSEATGTMAVEAHGKPKGAWKRWQERGRGGVFVRTVAPSPFVGLLYGEGTAFGGTRAGAAWLVVQFDLQTEEIVVHTEESPEGGYAPPDLSDNGTEVKRLRRLPGRNSSSDTWTTVLYQGATPGAGKTDVVYAIGRGTGAESERTTRHTVCADPSDAKDPGTIAGVAVERRPGGNVLTITRGTAGTPGAPIYCAIKRKGTFVAYPPITIEAGAEATLAAGATLTWADSDLDAADTYDYECCALVLDYSVAEDRPYAASSALVGYAVDPQAPADPPLYPPPSPVPDPVDLAPPSGVDPPTWAQHAGLDTPVEEAGGWVRVAWHKPAGAYGVALEKTYRSDNTGWLEVTFSTLNDYDNRVAGAYESGYYRLVAKSAGPAWTYLSISTVRRYTSSADMIAAAGGGGGGSTTRTQNVV